MIAPFHDALILTGPTGSGKSDLGVELALRLGAEIVSMDSMALYRGMDIATAKPGTELRRRVPHHLIDVLDPWESASVAWWLERAAACCREIEARGKRVLFVGGTPLYLKALRFGLFEGPPADAGLRQRLEAEAEQLGRAVLHQRLARVDPDTAARLHPNDVRRVVRALEVWELTGKPMSGWQTQWKAGKETGRQGDKETRGQGDEEAGSPADQEHANSLLSSSPCHPVTLSPCLPVSLSPCLWLDLPRAEVYARINARVRRMFDDGLIEEVQALRRLPSPVGQAAAQALGYKEVFDYLDGRTGLTETIERVQTRTRQFAKRQITWFRHLPGCRPVTRELTFTLWNLRMEGE